MSDAPWTWQLSWTLCLSIMSGCGYWLAHMGGTKTEIPRLLLNLSQMIEADKKTKKKEKRFTLYPPFNISYTVQRLVSFSSFYKAGRKFIDGNRRKLNKEFRIAVYASDPVHFFPISVGLMENQLPFTFSCRPFPRPWWLCLRSSLENRREQSVKCKR